MMIWIMTKPGAFAEDDEQVISGESAEDIAEVAESNDEEDDASDADE
jgi:hypothetical protein